MSHKLHVYATIYFVEIGINRNLHGCIYLEFFTTVKQFNIYTNHNLSFLYQMNLFGDLDTSTLYSLYLKVELYIYYLTFPLFFSQLSFELLLSVYEPMILYIVFIVIREKCPQHKMLFTDTIWTLRNYLFRCDIQNPSKRIANRD